MLETLVKARLHKHSQSRSSLRDLKRQHDIRVTNGGQYLAPSKRKRTTE